MAAATGPIAGHLPGFGRDVSADPVPKTLADGIEATARIIGRFDRPVMLLGHSLGGMTISGVAERMPEAIANLVYLTAVVPEDGQSTDAFSGDDGMKAGAGTHLLDDGERIDFTRDMARNIFYGDCDEAVAAAATATASLVPTDLGYLTTPVRLSPDRFGTVRKTYIVCTRDNAIDPEMQRMFSRFHGGMPAHEIATSHSPFLSRPAELAKLLVSL
jgi:pimeloyl-ACP methyl ester carboxylesterase